MTKTITIPISSESCDKIKDNITLMGWFLMPIFCWTIFGLGIYHAVTYNEFTWHIPVLLFSATFGFLTTTFLVMELKKRGKWVEFKCNCDKDDTKEPRGNYTVKDKDGKIIEEGIEN